MIRTTHVGSLPRGEQLVPLLLARDKGEPYDADEFDAKVQAAVDEAVRRQVECGVSDVSDGELGKVGPWVAWEKLANLRKGTDIADARIG